MNKRWFDKLPADLQKVMIEAIAEESARTRELTKQQYTDQIAKAKEAGVQFFKLSAAEQQQLIDEAAPVIKEWGQKIGPEYLQLVQSTLAK